MAYWGRRAPPPAVNAALVDFEGPAAYPPVPRYWSVTWDAYAGRLVYRCASTGAVRHEFPWLSLPVPDRGWGSLRTFWKPSLSQAMGDYLRTYGLAAIEPDEFQEHLFEWEHSPFLGMSWLNIVHALRYLMGEWEENGFRLKGKWRSSLIEAALWQHCYYAEPPSCLETLSDILLRQGKGRRLVEDAEPATCDMWCRGCKAVCPCCTP